MIDKHRQIKGAVVVTGASSGIGSACVQYLDKLGFQVFAGIHQITDFVEPQKLSERVSPILLDITDQQTIVSMRDSITDCVGSSGLVGLVNNAGIAIGGPLEFLPLASLRKQLEVNVIGQIAVTQALLPLIRKGNGRIVNIGSLSGRIATPLLGAYAASKFAMEAITDVLRVELSPWNIKVILIEPGITKTPLWKKSLAAGATLEKESPSQMMELYGPLISSMRRYAAKNDSIRGITPDAVASKVIRALTDKQPRARYLAGYDAHIGSMLARVLPSWMQDLVVKMLLERE